MGSSKKTVVRKKRGRPATGQDPVTAIRLSRDLRANVDQWAAKQDDRPGRSEAIRRLVEIGLAPPSQRLQSAHADRARELASKTIEKLGDTAAGPEERAHRRRRLTKGPTEFREGRIDQPKAKK
jgi:hypothetical protein